MQSPTQNTPSILARIWGVVKNACCIFTLCSVLLILINWAMAGTLDEATIFVDAFFMLYPLSLGLAAAHTLRQSQLSAWVKGVGHPVLCMGGIIIAYLPYQIRNSFPASTVMVHLLAFAVVYGLVMAGVYVTSLLIHGKKGKKTATKDSQPYTPLFSKKDQ